MACRGDWLRSRVIDIPVAAAAHLERYHCDMKLLFLLVTIALSRFEFWFCGVLAS